MTVVRAEERDFVSNVYDMRSESIGTSKMRVWTDRTRAEFDVAGVAYAFDSAGPTAQAPWAYTQGHLVSAVPVTVRLEAGHPVSMVGVSRWKRAARRAVAASGLPPEADAAGWALVDPDGVLADLQRAFPRHPAASKARTLTIKVSSQLLSRVEHCGASGPGTWSCEGQLATTDPDVAVYDGVSTSTIRFDGRGLVDYDSRYSGVLHVAGTAPRPFAEHRRVERLP